MLLAPDQIEKLRNLANLHHKLALLDLNNDDEYKNVIIQAIKYTEVTDDELAKKFDMSRPSIKRWRNGTSAPHPAMRKIVKEYLVIRLAENLCVNIISELEKNTTRIFDQANQETLDIVTGRKNNAETK